MKPETKNTIRFFFIAALILFIFFGYYSFDRIMAWDNIGKISNIMIRIFFTNTKDERNHFSVMNMKDELFLYSDHEHVLENISSLFRWKIRWTKSFDEIEVYGMVPFSREIIIGAGDQKRYPGRLTFYHLNTDGKEITIKDSVFPSETYAHHMSLWKDNEVIVFAGIMNENKPTKNTYVALVTPGGDIQKENIIALADYCSVTHTLPLSGNELVCAASVTTMFGGIDKIYIIKIDHELNIIAHRVIKIKACNYITGLHEIDGEIILTGGGFGNTQPCFYTVSLDYSAIPEAGQKDNQDGKRKK